MLALVALIVVLFTLSGRADSPGASQSVPTPGAPTSAAIAESTTPPSPQATSAPAERPLRTEVSVMEPNYEVQPGDTLGAIARRFGTSVEALRAYNKLEDAARLQIGQRLVVPQETPAAQR